MGGKVLCFREAVSEHAHNVDNHLALAHFHLERDELEGAMEHLERAPRKWESHGLRMLTRAVVVHRRGETERAAVDYESVCREYPELIDHEDLEYEHLWRVHAVAALRELQERD
ncbi:MAG: hypothetical protein GY856_48665 [bacterium]|nr:hypothetical protein [bacterium]